jgi:hypothetical protein
MSYHSGGDFPSLVGRAVDFSDVISGDLASGEVGGAPDGVVELGINDLVPSDLHVSLDDRDGLRGTTIFLIFEFGGNGLSEESSSKNSLEASYSVGLHGGDITLSSIRVKTKRLITRRESSESRDDAVVSLHEGLEVLWFRLVGDDDDVEVSVRSDYSQVSLTSSFFGIGSTKLG